LTHEGTSVYDWSRMYSFGIPRGAELAPAVQPYARTKAEWLPAALAGLLLLGGMMLASMARADDEKIFAELIPGEALEEAELAQFHGRGFSIGAGGLSHLTTSPRANAGEGLRERLLRGRAMKPTARSAAKSPRMGGTSFSRAGTKMPQAPRTDIRDSMGDRGVGGRAHSVGLARSLAGRDYGP